MQSLPDIDDFLLEEGIEYPKEIKGMYQQGEWLNFTYKNENKKISLVKFGEYIEKKI